jgi:hypothetical protein
VADHIYKALRPRTLWLKWLLLAWIVASLVEAGPRLAFLLQAMAVPMDIGLVTGEDFITLTEVFDGLFMLACAVAFAFWIYRANANLHSFGIHDIQTPGWAVGYFVIPVASWWLGYGVMRDIWNRSGPPDSLLDGKDWLLPTWWSSYLFTSIVPMIQVIFEKSFDPAVRAALHLSEPSANIIAGGALIAIITKLDIAQQQQESFEVF